jgi:hypothetical protein
LAKRIHAVHPDAFASRHRGQAYRSASRLPLSRRGVRARLVVRALLLANGYVRLALKLLGPVIANTALFQVVVCSE